MRSILCVTLLFISISLFAMDESSDSANFDSLKIIKQMKSKLSLWWDYRHFQIKELKIKEQLNMWAQQINNHDMPIIFDEEVSLAGRFFALENVMESIEISIFNPQDEYNKINTLIIRVLEQSKNKDFTQYVKLFRQVYNEGWPDFDNPTHREAVLKHYALRAQIAAIAKKHEAPIDPWHLRRGNPLPMLYHSAKSKDIDSYEKRYGIQYKDAYYARNLEYNQYYRERFRLCKFDSTTGLCIWKGPNECTTALPFLPYNNRLYCVECDEIVALDPDKGTIIQIIPYLTGPFWPGILLGFHITQNGLAVIHYTDSIHLIDLNSSCQRWKIFLDEFKSNYRVHRVAENENGELQVFTYHGTSHRCWKVDIEKEELISK